MINNLEDVDVSYNEEGDKVPIVETYINISNAYTFQNQLDKALEYAEVAKGMSKRILDAINMKYMQSENK
jgi:hypothetical protein